jgi:hypothetical protein
VSVTQTLRIYDCSLELTIPSLGSINQPVTWGASRPMLRLHASPSFLSATAHMQLVIGGGATVFGLDMPVTSLPRLLDNVASAVNSSGIIQEWLNPRMMVLISSTTLNAATDRTPVWDRMLNPHGSFDSVGFLRGVSAYPSGLTVMLNLQVPPICHATFCNMLNLYLGAAANINLQAHVSPSLFEAAGTITNAAVSLVPAMRNLLLVDCGVMIRVGLDAAYSIFGVLELQMSSTVTLRFGVHLTAAPTHVVLTGTMTGTWAGAFGLPRFGIESGALSLGYNLAIGIPTFTVCGCTEACLLLLPPCTHGSRVRVSCSLPARQSLGAVRRTAHASLRRPWSASTPPILTKVFCTWALVRSPCKCLWTQS